MRVTFDNFSGGVNNFIDPQKLSPTQAVDILDAEIVSGSVKSVPVPKDIATPPMPEVSYNPDGNRSLTKFGEEYYWSDNSTGEVSSSLGYMGIIPPESPPKFYKRNLGDRLTGVMKWACVFLTEEGFISAPASSQSEVFFTTIDATSQNDAAKISDLPYFNRRNIHTVHYSPHRTYRTHKYTQPYPSPAYGYLAGAIVQYKGKAYKCTADIFNPPSDGSDEIMYRGKLTKSKVWKWKTPASPINAPETVPSYNSPWKELTDDLSVATGSDSIVLELPHSTEASVSDIMILRAPSVDSNSFYEVATVPHGTKYFADTIDNKMLIATGREVYLFNYPPPINENPEAGEGGRYLTTVNEMFYLAVGNRVYFSEQSNPHAWDPLKFIVFDDEVTAIVPTQASVIVFPHNRRFFVSGSTFADLVKVQLPTLQGCPNWRTATTVGNHIVWQSNDGVAVFGKQPEIEGDQGQLLTADRYNFGGIANFAVSANEVYYLFFDDHVVAIDFKHNFTITKRNLPWYSASVYDENGDRLYLLSPYGVWQEDAAGDDATWSYTSPRLEPAPDKNEETRLPKKLRRLWIDADNDVDMTVFVDGEERWSKVIKKRARRDLSTYFKAGLIGQDVQFQLSSKGTMRSFTVDFRLAKGA